MSIDRCINNAEAAGWIGDAEADELRRRFRELNRAIPRSEEAARALVAELEAEAERRRFLELRQAEAWQRLESDALAFRDRHGRQDVGLAAQYLVEHHGQARFADLASSIKARMGMVHAELDAALEEFRKGAVTGDLRRQGGATKARLDNVVREMYGENTGDVKAKGLAQTFAAANERLRQGFNAAGGSIGKLEGGYMPQSHDPVALLKAGYDAWRDFKLPLLDRKRMRNPLTGGVMTDEDLERGMRAAFNRITTDGWIDREPSSQVFGKGMLANQHSDHRFFHFKDADAHLKYQREFGHGDAYASLMGHINTMVRDTVIMERLGPNPKATWTKLEQWVTKHAKTAPMVAQLVREEHAALERLRAQYDGSADNATRRAAILSRAEAIHADLARARADGRRVAGGDDWAKDAGAVDQVRRLQETLEATYAELEGIGPPLPPEVAQEIGRRTLGLRDLAPLPQMDNPADYARGKLDVARRMFELVDGTANTPISMKTANVLGGVRSFIVASSLGSAQLSAMSDLGFQGVARRFNGIPAAKMMHTIARQLFSRASRHEAVRAGLILDQALHVLHTQARYAGSIATHTKMGFLADRTIAMQGLSAWTQAQKHAFGIDLQSMLADYAGHAMTALPEPVRTMLDRHGLGADWDTMRGAALHTFGGSAGILRPQEVAAAGGRELAERYLAMIMREMAYSTPETTVRARAALTGGTKPGGIVGEMVRFGGQFKSFGVTVAMLHASRVAHEMAGFGFARGAKYAGALVASTMLLGGLSLQLKELWFGRTLRPASGKKGMEFWLNALLQGGGLGIFGDFLFADVNRFGGSLGQTVAGPLWDRATTLRNLTVGNAKEMLDADGRRTNAGRELVSFLRQNVPGSSLWYARLAWERVIMDQLQYQLDPDAHGAFRRRVQNRKRTIGNDFWWAPGQLAPGR